ncbi:MAG: hypothetical protein ABWK05_03945 [Pyrobaculum sp.]
MNKNVLIGIILAIIVVAAAVVILAQRGQHSPNTSTSTQTTPAGKVYVYNVQLQGGGGTQQMTAYFIPLSDGVVYGQVSNRTTAYFMLKNDGVINVLAQSAGEFQKITYYSKLLQICVNSTTTATVAGEKLTLTNSQCTSSQSPLPTAKNFDDVVFLIQGLPGPTSQSQWTKAGAAQTPFGQATVYTNTTTLPIMTGLAAVLSYEKQVLQDGTIYSLKVQLAYGTQVVATLVYTLQNVAQITPDLRNVVDELSKNVVATSGGGLDILRAAEKIGMSYNGSWPAVVVFFDLQCPYCAQLFKYNYTLFQGHKLVLVDLVVHPDALPAHERLRCLYQQSPDQVIPTLRILYDRFLAGDANYTNVLPQSRCPVDVEAGLKLATLLAGQNVGTPMVVVVYPNGTYTLTVGYDPAAIAKALRG